MNYITTHKKQLIILLVILPLVGLGVYLALNQTLLKSRASQGTVTFAPDNITKKPGESFVVSVSVNPNGASTVGVSTEISFNADLLDITPADIERGQLGDLTEKVVEKNGSAGKVKISAVNFNAQQQNYHTPTSASTVIATLTFKTKNNTGGADISFGDILVVAPGNNQTISVDKGANAKITISGQGLPRVAVGPSPINSFHYADICQAKGWDKNCIFDTISHIDGWDKPWQNDEFITVDGDWWVVGPIVGGVGGTRSIQTGKLKDVYPEVCGGDDKCKLTSVSQFKAFDRPDQNELFIVKGDKYWLYQPVDANDKRLTPTTGNVSNIDGYTKACQGLTNCQIQSVSHYKDFDKSNENYYFMIASGTLNGQPSTRFAIVPGLLQNGQVQSSRGQIISGDLMEFDEIKQLCSNSQDCSIRSSAQYVGWDDNNQNQDVIMAFVNGEGKFIVRNGLNAITTPTRALLPSCTLQISKNQFSNSEPVKFTITGTNIPANAKVYFDGKNGNTDINEGLVGDWNNTTLTPEYLATAFGGPGSYTRRAVFRANNMIACTTEDVTLTTSISSTGTPPTVPSAVACSLSVNRAAGTLNDDFTFTLTSPALAGAGIPSGSQLLWRGTNKGTPIDAVAAGTSTSSPQILGTFKGSSFGGVGTYDRYIQVMRNGAEICHTVPVGIVVSPAAAGASSLSANIVNSTGTQANTPATGSVGTNFPAGQFVASAFVPNTSSDNVTGTGMYIVKVDSTTKIPVANPTWNCNVPSGVTIGGSSTTNPVINVTDTNVPASFRTRYCVIADGVSGQKQFLNNITSKAFSVSEVGTYLVFIDANAGTNLQCTGASWEAYPGKTRCQANGSDSIIVTVNVAATTSPAAIKGFIDQIIADYGLRGGLAGDYNKDGKVDSLDFAFQLFKNR